MLGWFGALGLWVKVAVIASVLAIIAGSIWLVYHSIYERGYRDAEAKYKPQVQKLEGDLKNSQSDLVAAAAVNKTFSEENARLGTLLRDQTLAISKMEAAKIEAQNEARAALARVTANQKRYSAEIARLQSIVNGPPMTEGDCEEADSIMRTILRDRMPINTGAEADRDRTAGASGDGEGGGGAAVYQQDGRPSAATANQDRFEGGQQATSLGSCWAGLASAG